MKVHIQFFSLWLQDTLFRIVQLQQHYIKQGKCEQGPRNDKQFTITDFFENKNFGPIFFVYTKFFRDAIVSPITVPQPLFLYAYV